MKPAQSYSAAAIAASAVRSARVPSEAASCGQVQEQKRKQMHDRPRDAAQRHHCRCGEMLGHGQHQVRLIASHPEQSTQDCATLRWRIAGCVEPVGCAARFGAVSFSSAAQASRGSVWMGAVAKCLGSLGSPLPAPACTTSGEVMTREHSVRSGRDCRGQWVSMLSAYSRCQPCSGGVRASGGGQLCK